MLYTSNLKTILKEIFQTVTHQLRKKRFLLRRVWNHIPAFHTAVLALVHLTQSLIYIDIYHSC